MGLKPNYPVLAIERSGWTTAFLSRGGLSRCPINPNSLAAREGMSIIDVDGASFELSGVRRIGPAPDKLSRRIIQFLINDRYCTIAYDLTLKAKLSLEEVKARLEASIERAPDDWYDEELAAGEGGDEPISEETQWAAARARIRSTPSVPALIAWIFEERGEPEEGWSNDAR